MIYSKVLLVQIVLMRKSRNKSKFLLIFYRVLEKQAYFTIFARYLNRTRERFRLYVFSGLTFNDSALPVFFLSYYEAILSSFSIAFSVQVKTLAVSGRQVVLQLWDTAGQERYRSITRQYFRKADGVVVVYDVTNEKSFLSVRSWMQNVQVSTKQKKDKKY